MLTHGAVDSVSLTAVIKYGGSTGTRVLNDQIGISPDITRNTLFSNKGDSGAVIVTEETDEQGNSQVVGMFFASDFNSIGTPLGNGVANLINAVLDALNVRLCP
jgi:hypothetical protein